MSASLPAGEVQLWTVRPSRIPGSHTDELLAWLDEAERARRARLLRAADRHTFLVAHALVRQVLGDIAGVAPSVWRFEVNEHGRPEIASPGAHGDLRFNLSHTRDFAVCAVTRGCRLGVDAEDLLRDADDRGVAESYFSAPEIEDLRTLEGDARRARFLEYWTCKEAFIKAHGRGMSLPLNRFTIHLEDPVRVSFDSDVEGDPAGWQFVQARPTDTHLVACAVEGTDLTVRTHEATLVGAR